MEFYCLKLGGSLCNKGLCKCTNEVNVNTTRLFMFSPKLHGKLWQTVNIFVGFLANDFDMNSRNTNKNETGKLPEGWILCSSKSKSGRKYYFNTKTGKSSWTKPETSSKPGPKKKKEKEKDVKNDNSKKNTMKRKSDGSSEQSTSKKRKEETKSPGKGKQEPDTTKKSPIKITKTNPNSLNKSHNLEKSKLRHSSSPADRKTSLSSTDSPKTPLVKNLANNRLSQLRAELAEEVSQEEQKTNAKMPKDTQDQTNDFNQQSASPSQFFAANKILSSMKAQLPDKYCNKKQKDTYADIEEGISKTDYPILKPPSTPPQFSEASKLVSAIKSKLSYKGSKEKSFLSAKDRMETLRARLSNEMDSSEVENRCDEINEAMDVDYKEPPQRKPVPECSNPTTNKSSQKDFSSNKKDKVILVVDTNIFIHKLDFIKNIMNSHIEGYSEAPTLLVPWRVINELDRLKDNTNGYTAISKRARPAMDYLYKCLPENDRIKVQPLREANSHIYPCESPDDEILNCCLQQAERGNSVILLSNDKNLCNKAIANGIQHKELDALAVRPRPQSPASPHAAANVIKHVYTLLANILENEMRAKYENLWLHVLFKAPPWSLSDVLQCLLKHWIAVFNEVFPRIEHIIVDMKNALANIQSKEPQSLTQSEVANFKELCIEVAKRCQIIPEYMELAKKTVTLLETDCATVTEDQVEQDGDTHVIAALEKIWTIYSSYCAKLATYLNVPHSIEDRLSGAETLDGLIEKLQLFGEQISTLSDAMERVLLSDETTTEEMLKLYVNHFESAIKDSLKTIGVDVGQINESNLKLFCTKCKNMLQEASGKFSQLVYLLEVCRERLR